MKRIKDMLIGSLLTCMVIVMALPVMAASGSKTVQIFYDNIKLVVNGKTVLSENGGEKVLEPFIMDGTTYLPVRMVGNALNMNLAWDDKTKTVSLTTKDTVSNTTKDTTVKTDATTSATPNANDYITLEKAKSIALEKAGVAAQNARFDKAELDYDDGHAKYELDFHVGKTEYDCEINAITGSITKWEVDYD